MMRKKRTDPFVICSLFPFTASVISSTAVIEEVGVERSIGKLVLSG